MYIYIAHWWVSVGHACIYSIKFKIGLSQLLELWSPFILLLSTGCSGKGFKCYRKRTRTEYNLHHNWITVFVLLLSTGCSGKGFKCYEIKIRTEYNLHPNWITVFILLLSTGCSGKVFECYEKRTKNRITSIQID